MSRGVGSDPPGTAMSEPRRQWVYPLSVKGRFQRVHRVVGLLLQAFLFITPWLRLDGRPLVLFDLPGRRAWIGGSVFTPEDTIFIVLFVLLATFSLFFFTALWGRLWCGYGCPQTVFLEEWVRPIERWIEGERGARMARDRGPWTVDKVWRKAAKWTAFAVLSAVVALTFLSWFVDAHLVWTGRGGVGTYGVAGFLGALMFIDFAWFREQFCNYLCPYARFQSALMDPGSQVVAYNVVLGEPRQTRGAAAKPELTGACIDCKKCVAVCPQGIDVREGLQLECIACARCVDACTDVMGKLGEQSLIQYQPMENRPMVRPRTIAYGVLLSVLAAAGVLLLVTRGDLDASIVRMPGTLYIVDADGWVRNTYLLRVSNDTGNPVSVQVAAIELPTGAEFTVPADVQVRPAEDATVPIVIRVPGGQQGRTLPVTLQVTSGDDVVRLSTTFKNGS